MGLLIHLSDILVLGAGRSILTSKPIVATIKPKGINRTVYPDGRVDSYPLPILPNAIQLNYVHSKTTPNSDPTTDRTRQED